jgi:IS4 transposase
MMQRQVPIWYGVPGLVDQVRALGFDTFDDIVDHGYDSILDETQRHQAVFDQITQINQRLSLADCQAVRQQLRPRLEANFEQLLTYFRTNRRQVSNAILEFDYSTT